MKVLYIMEELQSSGTIGVLKLAAPVWMAHRVQLGIPSCGKIKQEIIPKAVVTGLQSTHATRREILPERQEIRVSSIAIKLRITAKHQSMTIHR